jgi:hypothetical protein
MRVAGLEQIGWIADALAAAEADRPLPGSLTDRGGAAAFDRLRSDAGVPRTTVAFRPDPRSIGTNGVVEVCQQSAALPALLALAEADPLVAAIDAVHHAVIAHGDDRDRLLDEAHAVVSRPAGR